MIQRLIHFVTRDIWLYPIQAAPRHRRFLLQLLRVLILAGRGYHEDRCQLRASALTFYTMLSIVPVVAMAFGVAKGFGFERRLEAEITEQLSGYEEIATNIIAFADSMLANTSGSLIAGIGVLLLFWTVIKLLSNVEASFNDIWGVMKGRSMGRQFADYTAAMLIGPLLLIISSSAKVYIASQVNSLAEVQPLLVRLGPVLGFGIKLVPVVLLWFLFAFLFSFMPNTAVRWRSALIGGIVTGIAYEILQHFYVSFQVGVAKYNAIYGSFAALPLLLIWVQLSWLLVLLGAEISFAADNVDHYEAEIRSKDTSQRTRKLLAIRLVELCAKAFAGGGEPPSDQSLAAELHAPVRLVRGILYDLAAAKVLSAVKRDDAPGEHFQPAMRLELLTISRILQALDMRGTEELPGEGAEELRELGRRLESFDRLIADAPTNIAVIEL